MCEFVMQAQERKADRGGVLQRPSCGVKGLRKQMQILADLLAVCCT